MSTVSPHRTAEQEAAVARAVSIGYVHDRDAEYVVKRRCPRERRIGALIVLFGRVIGHERAMIIYPDGSVVTQESKRGGSRTVTFDRRKLADALLAHGDLAPL